MIKKYLTYDNTSRIVIEKNNTKREIEEKENLSLADKNIKFSYKMKRNNFVIIIIFSYFSFKKEVTLNGNI